MACAVLPLRNAFAVIHAAASSTTHRLKSVPGKLTSDADLMKEFDLEKNKHINPSQHSLWSREPVWWRCHPHKTCDSHVWRTSVFNRWQVGTGCSKCRLGCACTPERFIASRKDLMDGFDPFLNPGIDPKTTAIHSTKYVTWTCPKHDTCDEHVWDTRICTRTRAEKQSGCPYCSGLLACSCEGHRFLKNNPVMAAAYNHAENKKLGHVYETMLHMSSNKKCIWTCASGHTWPALPATLSGGHGCPKCAATAKESKMEATCKKAVASIPGFTFNAPSPRVVHKKPLRWDAVCAPLRVLIELDGEQHFKPIDFGPGPTDFKGQRDRDELKNQFARDNNWNLLRIGYSLRKHVDVIVNRFIRNIAKANAAGKRLHQYYGWEYRKLYEVGPVEERRPQKRVKRA